MSSAVNKWFTKTTEKLMNEMQTKTKRNEKSRVFGVCFGFSPQNDYTFP
jgi:hypothetical protein